MSLMSKVMPNEETISFMNQRKWYDSVISWMPSLSEVKEILILLSFGWSYDVLMDLWMVYLDIILQYPRPFQQYITLNKTPRRWEVMAIWILVLGKRPKLQGKPHKPQNF